MDPAAIIAILRKHQTEFQDVGVKHMALFGSCARGEATNSSDVDVAVQMDRSRPVGLFELAAVRHRIAELLGKRVDIVSEPVRHKPRLQTNIDEHRLAAF